MVHAYKMTVTKWLKEFFAALILLCVFLFVNGGKKIVGSYIILYKDHKDIIEVLLIILY